MKGSEKGIDDVLNHWFPFGGWTIRTGLSGMNNTTHYIEVAGAVYVLRIYETHRDEAKVHYEHAVLLELAKLTLPFQTPVPVFTPEGDSIVRAHTGLEAGKLAALFGFLHGDRPTLETVEQIQSFGRATATLGEAMKRIPEELAPAYPPYYAIGLLQHQSLLNDVFVFCQKCPDPFQSFTVELMQIRQLLLAFVAHVPTLQVLPHQLIHGDLNASNMLAGANGDISALLDFEFVTWDLRVMDVAVSLSDLLESDSGAEEKTFDKVAAYIDGYGGQTRLTLREIQALPLLIQLRRLDVFVHFLSRYWDGIDSADIVKSQIRSTAAQADWLSKHSKKLIDLSIKHLGDN